VAVVSGKIVWYVWYVVVVPVIVEPVIVTQLTVALVLYVNVVVAVKVPVQSDGELHTPYSPPVADVGRYPRVNPRADSPHMYDPKTLYVPVFTVAHVLSVYSIRTTPAGYTNVVYDPS
jgi:hypothetical protein